MIVQSGEVEAPVAQPSELTDATDEKAAPECEKTTPGEVAEAEGIEAIPGKLMTLNLKRKVILKLIFILAVGADVVQETSVEPMETVVEPVDAINIQATAEANHVEDVSIVAPVEAVEAPEPAASTVEEVCEPAPVELPSDAESSRGVKRKCSIIYHDIQPDSLDAEEKDTNAALRAIAVVLLDMKRDRRALIKETKKLRDQARVHEKDLAGQRKNLPTLQELVKRLSEQESAHAEERNRRASAAKEAHENIFQTEIKLRELQLEIAKKKLKIGIDFEKNGENPEVQAIRQQEKEAAELQLELDRQYVAQREAESVRVAAEEQLNRSKEELSTARKQLEEAEKAMDVVVKEFEASNADIEQSVSRLRELNEKWKAKNIERLNLENNLIRINACRQLLKNESRLTKFSRISDPECSSDDSGDEKEDEKMDTSDAQKHAVSAVKTSEETSKAVAVENGSQVVGHPRIHPRPTRMSVDGANTAPSSGRPTSSTSSPAHCERNASVPQKSPSLIDSLAVRSAPPTSNLTPAFFAQSPDDLTQSSISTAIPFYAQLVRGSPPPALKDENTLCREVVSYCAHYARYCRSTQTTPPADEKAHHQKCAAMMKDFLIPFYHLLVMKVSR